MHVSGWKNNDNSEINSLSKFSIYEETSWVFQLETPCLAIGHFYNHHWKLKRSFFSSDQDGVTGSNLPYHLKQPNKYF